MDVAEELCDFRGDQTKSTSKFEKVLSNFGKVWGNFTIQSEGSQSSVEKK